MTRSRKPRRSGLLLNYTVHPDDIEQLAAQHTAFDPNHINRVPGDDQNDEDGWLNQGLQRWHDRDFRFG